MQHYSEEFKHQAMRKLMAPDAQSAARILFLSAIIYLKRRRFTLFIIFKRLDFRRDNTD